MISSAIRIATQCLTRNTILHNGKYATLPSLTCPNVRNIHLTSEVGKEYRFGTQKYRADQKGKNLDVDGESTVDISSASETISLFPTVDTPNKLFNGVSYNKLHILNIKSTPNNTIMSLTDYKGLGILTHSAGCEGFKHSRKGTNIAAQQTAIKFANNVIQRGVKAVRLRVQGIGPGRKGAIKGFQLVGLNVISITDDTRVSWNPPRPKKARRI